MWEPSNVAEKKFNEETNRLIGESKLHEFGLYLDNYNEQARDSAKKFSNAFNITAKPIFLDIKAYESVSTLYLTHSDNKILARLLATLGGLCREISFLISEAENLYGDFLFYGEDIGTNFDNIKSISSIIEPLQKVQCFVTRARSTIILTLRQMCAVLIKGYYTSSSITSFLELLNYLFNLLICLLKFDHLLDSQILKDHWFLYRRSIRNISHNSKYEFSRNDLRLFDKTLLILENNLLCGRILQDTWEKCLESTLMSDIKKCSLISEFSSFLYLRISELEKDEDHILQDELWLQLNIAIAFYFNIFGPADKRFIKRLLDINKKLSACLLIGNIVWYPEHFLLQHVQYSAKFIDERLIESSRLSYITSRSQQLPKDTTYLCAQACTFLLEIEQIVKLNRSKLKVKHLQAMTTLFIDGLKLTKKISSTIKWILNLHINKNVPVTKSSLICLSKLIEVLKAIYLTFNKNLEALLYLINLISQHILYKALSIIYNMKEHLMQERSYKEYQLDVISALNVCEHALKGPVIEERLLVANLALSASGLSGFNLLELRTLLIKAGYISTTYEIVKNSCDCSFLYWHHNYFLPVYFAKLISSKTDICRYTMLLHAITDCVEISNENFAEVINKDIKTDFFSPINHIIETNLRLQTHLHLSLPPSNPFRDYYSLNFRKCMPALMGKTYKSIKNETEHYLSTMFYNLTTVVLHDWKTYGEMRKLAYLQYSLETVDDDLPMQTIDQGLDVLEIMRNINFFVKKYLYNLNSQFFIEESSNNKHLNSINILHVGNSIRTHGIGIMNTTVNFTYQFLRNKFYVFSQFMFDEHIKSRLLKDIRFFNERKTELNQMYPYEKAEKFNIGIKRLGLNNNGESYLDLFRKAITYIGNAMGYIRLIRSGGRRCLADRSCFISDLKNIDNLKENLSDLNMSDLGQKALNCLIEDLQNVTDNFEEATEYFKLLVKVFVPVFRDKNNVHLKNFYIIVPPLTINFIEHSLTRKERLYKKNKADSAFTDDGFALGLAYIIELLDQESQLNSLHWFQSVQKKFKLDRVKINEQISAAGADDAKLKQTLTLTEKRITTFEREFQLLCYCFSSAKLFFQN